MNPPDDRSSEVHDFREILSNPIDGQLPLLVGGHAVNLWALSYQKRIGREMDQWLPLTSKDLDVFGTLAVLEGMKARFGGKYRLSGPRSPVIGQMLVTLVGVERQIDVLREVYGLQRQELAGEAVILKIDANGESHAIRVLPAIPLLQAKIANLANLDQANRNDFKHVNLRQKHGNKIRGIWASTIEMIAGKVINLRPFRKEPRAQKKRPKSFSYLTAPRAEYKSHIAENPDHWLKTVPFRTDPIHAGCED